MNENFDMTKYVGRQDSTLDRPMCPGTISLRLSLNMEIKFLKHMRYSLCWTRDGTEQIWTHLLAMNGKVAVCDCCALHTVAEVAVSLLSRCFVQGWL